MTGEAEPPAGVLLLGMGGLGCAAALALVGAGVARLGLVDDDRVDLSNLHRQILYHGGDIGEKKVARAAANLHERRPGLEIRGYDQRLEDAAAIAALAGGYRVVLDGTDNFATRFAASDAAVQNGPALVHGAATGWRGQLLTILPGGKPCLRCLFGGPPTDGGPTCRDEGVLGPLVGEVGWLMAMEAVKLLRGVGQPLVGRLLTIDAARGRRRTVAVPANPRCPACAV